MSKKPYRSCLRCALPSDSSPVRHEFCRDLMRLQVCLQHSFDFPQKYRIIIAEENANQVTAGFTGRFSTFSKPDIASTVYITTKQKFELLCF